MCGLSGVCSVPFQAELRELNEGLSSARVGDMKERAGSLKSAREEKRKEVGESYKIWGVV